MKIVAVTVTFNRPETFQKTIWRLAQQGFLHKIVVVSNGATQEVRDVIQKLPEKFGDLIEVLQLENNTGGAGGFFHGMHYAQEKYDPDWYWLMDDDCYPLPNCLSEMISKIEKHNGNIGFLAPAVYGVGFQKPQFYHHKKLSRFLDKDFPVLNSLNINISESTSGSLIPIDANAFLGILISKEATQKNGLPDKELFIEGDDTEYTYRISRNFESFLINKLLVEHEDLPEPTSDRVPYIWWKQYYLIRNRILFIKQHGDFLQKSFGISLVLIRSIKAILASVIKERYKRFRQVRLSILCKAVFDGLSRKSGKRIDPLRYNTSITKILNKTASS